MKNRVNGFLCEKNGLTGNQTGTTKFDHVEEKEKFFDCAFYPFRIVLSLFVSSSIEVLYWGGYSFAFPHNFSESFPKARYHERTRAH